MVFDVVAGQGTEEFEELSANICVSVEDEGEERWKHHAHWLREGRVDRARCDRAGEICEGVSTLAVGFGGEEREIVGEDTVGGGSIEV
jgi:hypothetical protein